MGFWSGTRGSSPVVGFRPRLLDIEETAPAAGAPVTLVETKEWLRVDGDDQDGVLNMLINAATDWAEGFTRRAFVDRDLDTLFGGLPPPRGTLYLPLPPVHVLTSASWQDEDLVETPFVIDTDIEVDPLFGLVRTLPGFSWPQNARQASFQYTAGFGSSLAVPDEIKQAILIAIAQMFEYRLDQTVGSQLSKPQTKASMALLAHHRMFEL